MHLPKVKFFCLTVTQKTLSRICLIFLIVGVGMALMALIYQLFIIPHYKSMSLSAPISNNSGDPSVEVTVAAVTLKPGDPVNNTERTVYTSLTPTLPLTLEELFKQQEKKLRDLPPCKPVLTNVKLLEEREGWEELLDKQLLREEVPLDRCDYNCGQCLGGTRCLPTKTTKIPVAVHYVNDNDEPDFRRKEMEKHLECKCN